MALAFLIKAVGGRSIVQVLKDTDWSLIALAWLIFLVGILVRAARWDALLRGLNQRVSFWSLLKLYLIGGFFNTFLPSGFGGDLVRILELGRGEQESTSAAAAGTVLVDRLTGILSLMLLGLIVLPFAQGLYPELRWIFAFVATASLLLGGILLEGSLLLKLTRWLPDRFSLDGNGKLAQFYAAVTGSGKGALFLALLWSTAFNLLNITVHGLCAYGVGLRLESGFFFVATPLLSLSLMIPLSVGGLGARDWLAQILLAPKAVGQSLTAAWTLSIWVVTAAAGLIGGFIYVRQSLFGLVAAQRNRDAHQS